MHGGTEKCIDKMYEPQSDHNKQLIMSLRVAPSIRYITDMIEYSWLISLYSKHFLTRIKDYANESVAHRLDAQYISIETILALFDCIWVLLGSRVTENKPETPKPIGISHCYLQQNCSSRYFLHLSGLTNYMMSWENPIVKLGYQHELGASHTIRCWEKFVLQPQEP